MEPRAKQCLLDLHFGLATEREAPFIAKAWKESLRHGPAGANVDRAEYFARANPQINALLSRARVLMARDADDPGFLYGFLAYQATEERLTAHFVYVKYAFRRQGVANALLAEVLERNPDVRDLVYTTPPTRFDEAVTALGFRHTSRS